MKFILFLLIAIGTLSAFAQGPYAPQAGVLGTTAIHADSSIFVGWANRIKVKRGKQDIAKQNSDTTSVGNWSQSIGKARGTIISLGDSGIATVQFEGLIYNGIGPDFAVFENAFNHTFLELAFVEVSSNGVDFYRFPSHSLTDTSTAIGGFGTVQPTDIHNLAGKYTARYGTPFDLADLDTVSGLDIGSISHVRIVDVVGTLDSIYGTRDSKGRKINDQYPTPFPSGGFDLDAVGAIYMKGVGLDHQKIENELNVYPNPSNGIMQIEGLGNDEFYFQVFTVEGRLVADYKGNNSRVDLSYLKSGFYNLLLEVEGKSFYHKIIIQ